MSSSQDSKIAPAPPPPPQVAAEVANSKGGFDPSAKSLSLELFAVAGILLGLGVGVIFAGGALAAWLTPQVPIAFDEKLGAVAAEQIELTSSECENPEAQKYVEELAGRILAQAGDLPFDFHFRVAKDEQVNAFALPGGYVTVNYGLLSEAESGEEVAGVLGHELQHALLRHGTRRMLRQMGSSALLSLALGGSDLHSYAQLASGLTGLSYDREQESEADREGVRMLMEAHIDPSGLSHFFQRLAESSAAPPELLSTHPDSEERARLVLEAAKRGSYESLPSPKGISCELPER